MVTRMSQRASFRIEPHDLYSARPSQYGDFSLTLNVSLRVPASWRSTLLGCTFCLPWTAFSFVFPRGTWTARWALILAFLQSIDCNVQETLIAELPPTFIIAQMSCSTRGTHVRTDSSHRTNWAYGTLAPYQVSSEGYYAINVKLTYNSRFVQ